MIEPRKCRKGEGERKIEGNFGFFAKMKVERGKVYVLFLHIVFQYLNSIRHKYAFYCKNIMVETMGE